MGQQFDKKRFSRVELEEFRKRLREETLLLMQWFQEEKFDDTSPSLGLELETWLTDQHCQPAPKNDEYLEKLAHPLVVPELSRFNVELNANPELLEKNCLSRVHEQLRGIWSQAQNSADEMSLRMLMIGSLPTITDKELTLKNMSDRERYRVLNRQIFSLRENHPIRVKIEGRDSIELDYENVMLEAAATSLQIHLQLTQENSVRIFNAALLASAPMAALCANAPFLFGKTLWSESRIPIFEQSLRIPGFQDVHGEVIRRVSFGSGYVRNSIFEIFMENLHSYPPILPIVREESEDKMPHVRLHNGTIWRWNRPILGVDTPGRPHLRIEHRVPSAGPTIVDVIGNIAFFIGLTHSLASSEKTAEELPPFASTRQNFYEAAKHGLMAEVQWGQEKAIPMKQLLQGRLLPLAEEGLKSLNLDSSDISYYLDEVIGSRIETLQNGASWQRKFIKRHGADFTALATRYFELQEKGEPVSQWPV